MRISFGSSSVLANKIYRDPARHLCGDKTTTLILFPERDAASGTNTVTLAMHDYKAIQLLIVTVHS